jgi:hypothetical protein
MPVLVVVVGVGFLATYGLTRGSMLLSEAFCFVSTLGVGLVIIAVFSFTALGVCIVAVRIAVEADMTTVFSGG